MDAVSLAAAVRAKQLSPVEVVEAALERMERLEPTLHAFCTPTPELARAEAKRIEGEITAGREVGPLAGVPVGIKDLVCTKGIVTASGSAAYKDFVPDEDDVCVERLRAADAIILGKTNVPEFGYSGTGHNPVFETTRNPWNPELTPGGSSAGSAAGVAAGMMPFAIGSDGGGSIRLPAAHCGLYGMKASMGRVPLYPSCRDERYPGVSSWEGVEHIGPISRTVADSALMLSVIAGPDDRDRHSLPAADFDWQACASGGAEGFGGLRVAFSEDLGYAAVDPEVRRIAREAAQVFANDLGCEVEEAAPGLGGSDGGVLGAGGAGERPAGDAGAGGAARGAGVVELAGLPQHALDGGGPDGRGDGAQGGVQQDVAIHAPLRAVPDGRRWRCRRSRSTCRGRRRSTGCSRGRSGGSRSRSRST